MLHLYAGSVYLKSYSNLSEVVEDLADRDEFYFLGLKLTDGDLLPLYKDLELFEITRS